MQWHGKRTAWVHWVRLAVFNGHAGYSIERLWKAPLPTDRHVLQRAPVGDPGELSLSSVPGALVLKATREVG